MGDHIGHHRGYVSKEDSSSPTVSIYALMAQCVMNAMEGRKVVTCNIPGAFLQLDWPEDDDYYIKFEGLMVDCNIIVSCVRLNPET